MDKGPKSAHSFSQWLWLLVQPPPHLVTCAHHKKFLILLNKLRLLWIHATDYVHFSAVSYIIIYYCHVAQNVLYSPYIIYYMCYSLTPQNLKSLVHRISRYGKCKMVDLVVINCQAYFLQISNEENIDQPMIKQFSEIAQRCISWNFNWKAYINRGQHKSNKFWQWTF